MLCRGSERHFFSVRLPKIGYFAGKWGDERKNAQFAGAAASSIGIGSFLID